MGELSGRFDARQRAARETLTAHHDEYLGERAAAHVDRLVPAGVTRDDQRMKINA